MKAKPAIGFMSINANTDPRRPEVRPASGDAHAARRIPTREVSLSRRSIDWLAELAPNVRPGELAVRFPHIANNLAAVWYERDKCCEYFDSLMRDRRGGRKGFPPRVAFELTALKRHHEALLRRPQRYTWNDTIVR